MKRDTHASSARSRPSTSEASFRQWPLLTHRCFPQRRAELMGPVN